MRFHKDITRIDLETIGLTYRLRNFSLDLDRIEEIKRLIRSNEALIKLYRMLQ